MATISFTRAELSLIEYLINNATFKDERLNSIAIKIEQSWNER